MLKFLGRRTVWSLASLLIFVTITFYGMSLLPFDYASRFGLGCRACADEVRESLGLDRSVNEQYLDFLGELASGSLGTSFSGRPVSDVIFGRPLWVTVLVFGLGAVLAFLLGIWLGRLASWRASSQRKGTLNTIAILGFTIFPPFLVFLLLRYSEAVMRWIRPNVGVPPDERHVWAATTWTEVDAIKLVGSSLLIAIVAGLIIRAIARRYRWPSWIRTWATPAALASAVASWALVDAWKPALTVLFHAPRYEAASGAGGAAGQGGGNVSLALFGFMVLAFGEIMLVVEASMQSERDEHYIFTARAKGLTDGEVRDRHALRNAILPALTRFVIGLPLLLTGLIIVERELELPGLSTVFLDAALAADLPLVTGALLLFGAVTLGAKLLLEILVARLDPRIHIEGSTL